MGSRIVFATFSTWVTPTVAINKGEPWDADDPVVASHPDWFSDVPPDVRTSAPPVPGAALPWGEPNPAHEASKATETADAPPGSKRARRPAADDDEG